MFNQPCGQCDDLIFVLFLTPVDPAPSWTLGQRLIDFAIRVFQPAPIMAHVEIFIPPSKDSVHSKCHFATYIGRTANWCDDDDSKSDFYFREKTNKWRAVPIARAAAGRLVREEASLHCQTSYSILKYPFSAAPLRAFAGIFSDDYLASGHCATITARVLKRALRVLVHPSGWYSPSTLLIETSSGAIAKNTHSFLVDRLHAKSIIENENILSAIDTLTRGSDDAVRSLSHSQCSSAVRQLATGVASRFDTDDEVGACIAQTQLATALLRWSITSRS